VAVYNKHSPERRSRAQEIIRGRTVLIPQRRRVERNVRGRVRDAFGEWWKRLIAHAARSR
jgi:hypothetical protein